MQIRIFNIPIPDSEEMNSEMNRFLRSKKVLQTESHLVTSDGHAYWCFCIKYLDDTVKKKRQKVDYREVLDKESFLRFSAMRKIRKQLAQDEGIPAYAIFTDEEMAGLAQVEILTAAAIRSVKGVGEKKVEKYGHHFLTKDNEKGK